MHLLTAAYVVYVAVSLLHAALRLRNIKNKMANRMEEYGLQKTPMGSLLVYLELVEEKMIQSKTGAKLVNKLLDK